MVNRCPNCDSDQCKKFSSSSWSSGISMELTLSTGGNSSSSSSSDNSKRKRNEEKQGHDQSVKRLSQFKPRILNPSSNSSNINRVSDRLALSLSPPLFTDHFIPPPPYYSSSNSLDGIILLPHMGRNIVIEDGGVKVLMRHEDQDGHHQQAAATDDQELRHNEEGRVDHDRERFNIIKKLENSDVSNHLGRLLLGKKLAESHILSVLSDEDAVKVKNGEGSMVTILDMDEGSDHAVMFKKVQSSKSYVFSSHWVNEFVKRRRLRAGDTIGMYWNPEILRFCFSILERAQRQVDDDPIVATAPAIDLTLRL